MSASLADIVEAMAKAGASVDAIVAVVRAAETAGLQRVAERRAKDVARKRRQRSNSANNSEQSRGNDVTNGNYSEQSRGNRVTSRDIAEIRVTSGNGETSPPEEKRKVSPCTPSKEKTHPPSPDIPGLLTETAPLRPDPVIAAASDQAGQHDDIVEAFGAYNAVAREAGWPVATKLTTPRRASLRKRMAECGGLDGWTAAMARARASPFLCGANDRGWRADLDFFLQASSFVRLMEGKYDDRQHRAPSDRTKPVSHTSAWASFAAEYADRGDAGGGCGFDADGDPGASGPDRRGQVDYLPPDPRDRRCDGAGPHGRDAGGYREPDGGLFGRVAFA